MVQTEAKVTFTTSAMIALTGMSRGRETARLDGAVRQDQWHPAQNQRGSAGKLGTIDDCDRGGFEFKSASRAFVISAADQWSYRRIGKRPRRKLAAEADKVFFLFKSVA